MNMKYLEKFSLLLLASVSASVMATPAYAQTNEGVSLDEIVVTAQKREENLQRVPLAVTAINSDKIQQLGIEDSEDISGLAPNLTIVGGTTSLNASVISIRGIPSPATETFGLDTANAFYIDGVYIARSATTGMDALDLERVEVLRGPQGTLFGRNTTGGAVNFITKAPTEESSVKAEVGAGNYGLLSGKINVQPGRIAGFDTSFSYSHKERDGTVDNLLESDDSNDPGAKKTDSFRFAAKADLGDTGSIRYSYDRSEVVGRVGAFQLTNLADGTPRGNVTVGGTEVTRTQQAPVEQYLQTVTFNNPDCAALSAPTRSRRDTICLDEDADASDITSGHTLIVENDFGPIKVKSTTAKRDWDGVVGSSDLDGLGGFTGALFDANTLFNGLDAGALATLAGFGVLDPNFVNFLSMAEVPKTNQNLFDTSSVRSQNQFSQEFEFSGEVDAFDWVVGAFYFEEEGRDTNPQNAGFVLDTNQILAGNFGFAGPTTVGLLTSSNPAQYRLVPNRSILDYTVDADSKALYGQFKFFPGGRDGRLSLTAGGRYTWDSKSLTKFQDGGTPFTTPQSGQKDFSKFTWNLMANYEYTDTVNLYARVATGYRSGGFNAADRADPVTNELKSFDEETLTSFEGGVKSELFDRRLRLNVSAFYNQYSDLAVAVPIADLNNPGSFAVRVANAGDVEYLGFEVEAQALITDHISINGNLGYVDTKYNEFFTGTPATGTEPVNIASEVVPSYTSPLTANLAVNYVRPVNWRNSTFRGRLGYTHEDGKYSAVSQLSGPFRDALKGDDRDVFDAQIGLYDIEAGGADVFVQLWGKNLGDDDDFVRGVDFGALGFAGGYFADPRTYGITLGVEY